MSVILVCRLLFTQSDVLPEYDSARRIFARLASEILFEQPAGSVFHQAAENLRLRSIGVVE